MCGKVLRLNNGWYHFIYRRQHYLYIPDEANKMIRISIPHVASGNDYSKETVGAVVNETNREVKFVKASVLNNGSISLDYDHKVESGMNVNTIVRHVVVTLFAASEYLLEKLNSFKL